MPQTVLEVTNLLHRYPGASAPAVDGLSFRLPQGEILGLLGPNGAGKTTTLHTILGLLEPTSGDVRVFGHSPITERLQILHRINFASVDVELPSNLTVVECLKVFAGFYTIPKPSQQVEHWMQALDLAALAKQTIGSLSSGERMRLKLCKALLNSPELLILDEPTLSLDPYIAHKVRELLKKIQRQRGMAILHTSHNMQEVETFCDRILFLHQGKLLAEGSPKTVLEQFKSTSLNELFIRVAATGELSDANL